ncbi:MAG: ribonuclease HII [Hyphomonadaceae bacterium]|nr:MAG: ribonuclease HII [Caulobacteraceae bacterium]MBT9447344.1 ribonuclease HII [Hyphomonadaceae bacterium]TPW03141.1 MAG: ribonuclease HII [Alphaproteobacteria bacterium]
MSICGIDEAGRGPLAGPVVAAAVILPARRRPKGLADSKVLDEATRNSLYLEIRAHGIVGVGVATVAEIDTLNIRQATLLAMRRAVAALTVPPTAALVDGNDPPDLDCPIEAIIDGDAHVPLIGAASIIAKVTRDRMMIEACARYPGYGFARHKGYGVPEHKAALAKLGPCAIHRMSFKPVAEAARR